MKKLLSVFLFLVIGTLFFDFFQSADAFKYAGSLTKNNYSYTDYFIVKNSNDTYVGVFYNASCYGSSHITNPLYSGQFKPSCSTGDMTWYGTGCDSNMNNCAYSGNFAFPQPAYINSVFAEGSGVNYIFSNIYSEVATSRDVYSSSGAQSLMISNMGNIYVCPLLPFVYNPYNQLTYTQKIVGFDFDGTFAGYERELYTPNGSGIRIYNTGQGSHSDLLATGIFTGNANETISAHNGDLDNPVFFDSIKLNETTNCFANIKSNVDIRWTTYSGQYGNIDNCGNSHEEGDLVVPKNLNANGTEPINNCIYPSYCAFPDFINLGANIRDKNNTSDYVYSMDEFDGVPSYLNSKSDGTGNGSYYQCTEYAARYLHSRFGTNYSDSKYTN